MMKQIKYTLVLLLGSIVMLSCGENFNAIYFEEPPVDDNVVSGDDLAKTKVEILPTLYDEEFGLLTRGTGPLESWNTDREHWMNARFHTFAFRSRNFNGGQADYRRTNDENYCLLWDQPLGIVDANGQVSFYNNFSHEAPSTHKFFGDNLFSRWKFFLLNTDDAKDVTYTQTQNKVVAHLKLDGRQDLMHSFAYHTTADQKAFEDKLNAMGPDNDLIRVFTEMENQHTVELLYSPVAGRLGLQPKFNLKHLLTCLDIYVVGAQVESDQPGFLQVLVDECSVIAPNKVAVTVADDSWEQDSYKQAVGDGSLLITESCDWDFQNDWNYRIESIHPEWNNPGIIIPRKMETNAQTKIYRPFTKFETLWQEALAYGIYHADDQVHHVYTADRNIADKLCESVMLPPQDEYLLAIKSTFLDCVDDNGQLHLRIDKDGKAAAYERNYTYPIKLDGAKFQPGKKYTVVVYVYPNSRIFVSVSLNSPWKDGGMIDVDSQK